MQYRPFLLVSSGPQTATRCENILWGKSSEDLSFGDDIAGLTSFECSTWASLFGTALPQLPPTTAAVVNSLTVVAGLPKGVN